MWVRTLLHTNKEGEIALVNGQELRHAKPNKHNTQHRGNGVRLDTEAMLASSLKMDWILHARG